MSDDVSTTAPPKKEKDKNPRDPEKWIHRPMKHYRQGRDPFAFRPPPRFFELADHVVLSKRTLLGYDRLYVFWQAIQNLIDVPGSVAEIGTYRGGSAHFIASAFAALSGAEVPFHVFDTFEGHPEAAVTERDPEQQPGFFSGTSDADVRAYLSPFARVVVHKGNILDVLPGFENQHYRLVHVDTDLYLPTKACLEYFGPRLSSSGVLVVDDYASFKCEGVRAAVGEFVKDTGAFQIWDMRTEQLMLVKR